MSKLSLASIALLAGSTAAIADIPNPARARTIATDGQNATGLPGLQIDLYNAAGPNEYSTPTISRSGIVAFLTTLSGAGVVAGNNEAAYLGLSNGALQFIAREGTQAPGLPAGINYGTFSYIDLLDPTHVVLAGALAGAGVPTSANAAIYFGDPASWAPIAVKGADAPGLAPLSYSGFDYLEFSLSTDGHLAFPGTVTGLGVTTANDKAIWISHNGATPVLAVRESDPAPGFPAGAVFANFLDVTDSLNSVVALNGGGIFVHAITTGGGVTTSNDTGLWSGMPGALNLIIRKGDPAPTLANPIIVNGISAQACNASGVCVFEATLSGTGTGSNNNMAVYKGSTNANLTIIARKGSPAPGYPAHNLSDVNATDRLRINASGQVVMHGVLTGGGATANDDHFIAVINANGTSSAVAREGQQYPDLPAGVVMNGTFSHLTINDDGQVVFGAVLRGTGVVAANNETLWSWTTANGLRLLAREGESMLVSASETRTTASTDPFDLYGNSGNDDGYRSSFSNGGELVLRGFYTDGSSRLVVLNPALYACGAADLASTGGTPGYDGALDNNDFVVFIDYFFAQNPLADQGSTGGVPGADGAFDNNDFVVFIDNFFGGCV
ncbi:MAG TPA: choice-of-anchor tandem repeat NxxGxxAF-containing protein [Phycisphaerales bacterium]|nr:choice-of-anchor tandem repeat NxxGxxAF-containing protein [Phycisphaerales bacterium]